MDNCDIDSFASLMTSIGDMYSKKINENLLDIYFASLRRFDFEAVKSAFGGHINDPERGQFFPKPADVVRLIDGTLDDSARIAWDEFYTALKRYGSHSSYVFGDKIIHRVVADMGGIRSFAMATERDNEFRQKGFIERYKMHKRSGNVDAPAKLSGVYNDRLVRIDSKNKPGVELRLVSNG